MGSRLQVHAADTYSTMIYSIRALWRRLCTEVKPGACAHALLKGGGAGHKIRIYINTISSEAN